MTMSTMHDMCFDKEKGTTYLSRMPGIIHGPLVGTVVFTVFVFCERF